MFPVCFGAAFLVGEGLFTLTGYGSAEDTVAPLWAVGVAGVPALGVFEAHAVLVVHFGGGRCVSVCLRDSRQW